jgi:BolA family transcriptional regulator, general stress-responsive regulator
VSNSKKLDLPTQMRSLLIAKLAPSEVTIRDDSAAHLGHAGAREGGHFRVVIYSARFLGLAPLARHRLVYEALAPLMGQGIHALSIDARLPS